MGPTFCCLDSDFGGLCWVGRVLCLSASFPEWQRGESIPSFQTHMARVPGNTASTVQPKWEGTLQQEVQEERGLGFKRRQQNRCEIGSFICERQKGCPAFSFDRFLETSCCPLPYLLTEGCPEPCESTRRLSVGLSNSFIHIVFYSWIPRNSCVQPPTAVNSCRAGLNLVFFICF